MVLMFGYFRRKDKSRVRNPFKRAEERGDGSGSPGTQCGREFFESDV